MSDAMHRIFEWSLAGRSFKLRGGTGSWTLTTPDGRNTTLSRAEWRFVADMLREAIDGGQPRARTPAASMPRARRTAKDRAEAAAQGKPWSDDLDEALTAGWTAGADIPTLAERFARTPAAIVARLVRLGLITTLYDDFREEVRSPT